MKREYVPALNLLALTLNKRVHEITDEELEKAAMTGPEGIEFRRQVEKIPELVALLEREEWKDGQKTGGKVVTAATHHIDGARKVLAGIKERYNARQAKMAEGAKDRVGAALAGLNALKARQSEREQRDGQRQPRYTAHAALPGQGLARLAGADAAKRKRAIEAGLIKPATPPAEA